MAAPKSPKKSTVSTAAYDGRRLARIAGLLKIGTPPRVGLLTALAARGTLGFHDVVTVVGTSSTNVSQSVLPPLVAVGFVQAAREGKARSYRLTKSGKQYLRAVAVLPE